MRLMLPAMAFETLCQITAQEPCCQTLIRTVGQPHPDKMEMIRHQRIDRTQQLLPYGSVNH